MKRNTGRNMLFILVLAVIGMQGAWAANIEDLLKKGDYTFKKADDGSFAVAVSWQEETSMIYIKESKYGEGNDDALRLAYLYCVVLPGRNNGNYPAAELKEIAEMNDKLSVGKVSIGGDDGTIYYISSFWLSNADEKTLTNELFIAHIARQQIKKVLTAYNNDSMQH